MHIESSLCDGTPVVRFSKKNNAFVTGCSRWSPNYASMGVQHYFWKLDRYKVDETGAEVIKKALNGESVDSLSQSYTSAFCTIVLEKKRRTTSTWDVNNVNMISSGGTRTCRQLHQWNGNSSTFFSASPPPGQSAILMWMPTKAQAWMSKRSSEDLPGSTGKFFSVCYIPGPSLPSTSTSASIYE